MAKTIENHIHLDTVTPPVATYKVRHESWDFSAQVPIEIDRGVTGELHVHRIVDPVSGDPYQFVSDTMTLKCTLAEMVVVKALAGHAVYFVPSYHDAGHPAGEIITSILLISAGGIFNIDPAANEWHVKIQIVDDDTV